MPESAQGALISHAGQVSHMQAVTLPPSSRRVPAIEVAVLRRARSVIQSSERLVSA
jgi:hypothetical protein